VERSDFPTGNKLTDEVNQVKNPTAIARIISAAENFDCRELHGRNP
jgi:methylmalonyl-CoA mutase